MRVHALTQTLLLTWLTVYLPHGLNEVWKQGFGRFASLVFLTLEAELDYNTSSGDTGVVYESIPIQKIKTTVSAAACDERCLTGNSLLPGMGPWASCHGSAVAGIVGK